jgi:DNA-binding transcriptional ArsR family regulator
VQSSTGTVIADYRGVLINTNEGPLIEVPKSWVIGHHLDKCVSYRLPLAMAYGNALMVLADPTRRRVFERLRAGPRPVNVLAAGLPVSRPAVSQHLKALKAAGLVEERSEGVRRIYSIKREGLMELRQWLDSFWGDALEAFKLEAEKSHKTKRSK